MIHISNVLLRRLARCANLSHLRLDRSTRIRVVSLILILLVAAASTAFACPFVIRISDPYSIYVYIYV